MLTNNKDIITLPLPNNPDARWITVDNQEQLISEGMTPAEAIEKAKLKTDNYTVVFVPREGSTYIF